MKEAGGIVIDEPFAVSALRDALELSLRLPDGLKRLRRDAVQYARQTDFYHRTEDFWKFIEETGHA